MPVRTGKDSKGCWARWGGSSNKKYYYECGNDEARERAKRKAAKQGQAAQANQKVWSGDILGVNIDSD